MRRRAGADRAVLRAAWNHRKRVRSAVVWLLAGCASVLSGCAVYHPKPLPVEPDLARAPALTVPAASLDLPGLKPQLLDPARGFTEINIITLAVAGNPQLKAQRLQAGVARAQLLDAGLLPDPQIAVGLSTSSQLTGYSATLTEDIRALITRGTAQDAAAAHVQQVNLDILWQEWQVAEHARELYIQALELRRLRGVLDRRRRLLARLYRRDQLSLGRHYATVGDINADVTAWMSAEADWRTLELRENKTRHALNQLLGLDPDVRLRLRGKPDSRPLSKAQYRAALAALSHRRADLLALQAGYRSAEANLREAILAQFPLVSATVQKARSAEEGVQTIGFDVTLTLPLFNRNRGAIAIGRASRAHLSQIYQSRLDKAVSQADRVWNAACIMQRQLGMLDARRSQLEQAAAAARDSLRRGELSLADYVRVDSNVLAVRTQTIRLQASIERARAALATLLALPF